MNPKLPLQRNVRILVIDDQENIHDDYRKIVGPRETRTAALDAAAAEFFGEEPAAAQEPDLGFELDSAFQGEDGYRMVQHAIEQGRPYAMAFVDIRMPPGWDGVETVQRIWEIDTEILIVLCSAHSDYSWEQMVEKLGRTDRFLILKKPFDNIEVRQFAMALTERWSLARTDALTGAMNRRALQEQLQREWARSVRYETPLACAMLDLDYFKKINDVQGHQAGDAVLKCVAATIQSHCRASDLLFRYGGEEFCVLLPNTREEDAALWAERTREAIANLPVTYGDRTLIVTASVGVAERLADTRSAVALVDLADNALRVAKQDGRNCVVRFSADDSTVATPQDDAQNAGSLFRGVVARDVMSLDVATISRATTVGDAARFFLDHGLNSVPVVGDNGELIGIVCEKDVLGVMLAPDSWNWPISRISQADVVSYDEQTPVVKIFDFLSRVTMRRVVIVRDGRPIGSISRTSLLRWFSNWVLVKGGGLLPGAGTARPDSKARLVEVGRSLAVRAARLADELSSKETTSPLNDDLYGPLIGDLAAMQEMLREIVAFSIHRPVGGKTAMAEAIDAPSALDGALALV
jgi:diguanylate cyclase (GGDEF)-like protein